MIDSVVTESLDAAGLQGFDALCGEAVDAVTERFYATHDSVYQRFGQRGRAACREDLAFHLEFLRPALEFGLLQPMVDYLCWLSSVLSSRAVPAQHLPQSLDWLGEYFSAHLPGRAGELVAASLQQARTRFVTAGAVPQSALVPPEPWPEAAEFESALLGGRQGSALQLFNQCLDRGEDLVDVELHVMQPALYAVGEKWQANEISVAKEHMATAIAQSVMTAGLLRAIPSALTEQRVLLACVEGNNHALGLRMVSDAFLLAGWDVQYLGANVPTRALVQQAVEWQPNLVGLSVSFPQQLPVVKQVIAQLAGSFDHRHPPVIIGGLAINRFTRLADMVGADAFSLNARTALETAQQVIAGKRLQ